MKYRALSGLGLAVAAGIVGCEQDSKLDGPAVLPDAATERPLDGYIPPSFRLDAGPLDNPESTLATCVEAMSATIAQVWRRAGCGAYPDSARTDPSSDYHAEAVAAVCLELSCNNRTLEGHNGIPATRSCGGLIDLQKVLDRAATDAANEDGCASPSYSLRDIALDAFVGGEPCDQLRCSVGPDGTLITSQRD